MAKVLVHNRTFRKSDGMVRNMLFVRPNELSAENRKFFGLPEPRTDAVLRKYAEGMELVFDLEAKDFRVFNWKTAL